MLGEEEGEVAMRNVNLLRLGVAAVRLKWAMLGSVFLLKNRIPNVRSRLYDCFRLSLAAWIAGVPLMSPTHAGGIALGRRGSLLSVERSG